MLAKLGQEDKTWASSRSDGPGRFRTIGNVDSRFSRCFGGKPTVYFMDSVAPTSWRSLMLPDNRFGWIFPATDIHSSRATSRSSLPDGKAGTTIKELLTMWSRRLASSFVSLRLQSARAADATWTRGNETNSQLGHARCLLRTRRRASRALCSRLLRWVVRSGGHLDAESLAQVGDGLA